MNRDGFLLIFLVFLIITGCEGVIDKTEGHGEPRIFTHPETGREYYYEVPGGVLYIENIRYFCDSLDYNGRGWYWATIDDLRALATNCPKVKPGGECGVTSACKEKSSCYNRDQCSCSEEELEKNEDGTLKTISLLHDADDDIPENNYYVANSCYVCGIDDECSLFWNISFGGGGSIHPDNTNTGYGLPKKQTATIICVRDPQ